MVFFLFYLKSKNTYHEDHEENYLGHRSAQINNEKKPIYHEAHEGHEGLNKP
jgi:hypothetical protein